MHLDAFLSEVEGRDTHIEMIPLFSLDWGAIEHSLYIQIFGGSQGVQPVPVVGAVVVTRKTGPDTELGQEEAAEGPGKRMVMEKEHPGQEQPGRHTAGPGSDRQVQHGGRGDPAYKTECQIKNRVSHTRCPERSVFHPVLGGEPIEKKVCRSPDSDGDAFFIWIKPGVMQGSDGRSTNGPDAQEEIETRDPLAEFGKILSHHLGRM